MLSHFLRAVQKTSAPPTDPNFNQVALLLHGDGTNGAQNNTFLDSSTNNFSITRNGNTTQGTFTPYSLGAGYWSNFFDGTGDFLSAPSNSAFTLTDDFTLEAWVYISADSALDGSSLRRATICSNKINGGAGFWFYINGDGSTTGTGIALNAITGGGLEAKADVTVPKNQWNHIAVSRSGSTTKIFLNGVSQTLTVDALSNTSLGTGTTFYAASAESFSTKRYLNGYISNLRVVKGTAVYTSDFTPSTTPLTAITNTSLLTCQSNRFVDNSSNNFAITRNGDVRVTAFSPFAPTSAYSTSVVGGSGYFDGTGDFLTTASSSALDCSGDFTFECWFYLTATVADYRMFISNATTNNTYISLKSGGTGGILQLVAAGVDQANLNLNNSVVPNTWNHVAVVRSGTTLTGYINGVSLGSVTSSANFAFSNGQGTSIGKWGGGSQFWTGYLSNLRIVKGTAVYTSDFTPPTAPLTAITNTSLLLNFTNAGIFDNAANNDLETVGDAQVSTSVTKFGTGSMSFDGTGDLLTVPDNVNLQLGTGNFTIEGWIYLNAIGSQRGFVAKGTSTTGWALSVNALNQVVFTFGSSNINSTGLLAMSTWYFVTVVREGTGTNQTKIYINGTNDGTGTVSTNFNQTSIMYIGAGRVGGNNLDGYIDDLRITKGVARYTANFTPPTAAFPNQ
jgi:hypothetical protein